MYNNLSFTEYVTTILSNSIKNFEPGYMERFKSFQEFKTEFSDFESFMKYYSRMLLQAKDRAIGNIRLETEPYNYLPYKGLISYNLYDERHIYPIFKVQVQKINDTITLYVPPF